MTKDSLETGVLVAGQQHVQLQVRQLICAHCRRGTVQRSRNLRTISPEFNDGAATGKECVVEKAWSCDFCNEVTIELIRCGAVAPGGIGRKILEIVQVWPARTPRELAPEVPAPVRDRFREGSVCEGAGAYRGAAGMYRAAVEELCKELGATQTSLNAKIEGLRDRLPDDLILDLHETRMLGNYSLHDGLVFSPEEVADVAELIVEMAEILYVAPARKTSMREARRQRRQAYKNGDAADDLVPTGEATAAG
ncbi:DUF4145 domain-containing protein [Nonomuraea fuscirosea]|uniref:DUF4145 domain-containing protein n=1 Tax=Nonomuraea fuscirosea TaxID=1291556 RepID=UPI0037B33941